MRISHASWAVFALLFAGCGGAAPASDADQSEATQAAEPESSGGEAAPATEESTDGDIEALEAELEPLLLREGSDIAVCHDAAQLRDAICDLSDRICQLADSGEIDASRCEDARSRCERATQRVDERCAL